MTSRSSPLDSGANRDSATEYYRRHTVAVRARVEVGLTIKATVGIRAKVRAWTCLDS